MSSKNAANIKLCQGKDVLERMNYLYQASHLMALRSKNSVAASYYGNIMAGCAKKAVLRMNPDVKRTVCKSCQSPLIPGETARVRLTSKPIKMVRWTCLTCNTIRKFPTKRGYKLWADESEALVEFFDYTPKPKKVISSNQNKRTDDRITEPIEADPLFLDCKSSDTHPILRQNEENKSSEKVTSICFNEENIDGQDKDLKSECNVFKDLSSLHLDKSC